VKVAEVDAVKRRAQEVEEGKGRGGTVAAEAALCQRKERQRTQAERDGLGDQEKHRTGEQREEREQEIERR
jgi:hypothetical protein